MKGFANRGIRGRQSQTSAPSSTASKVRKPGPTASASRRNPAAAATRAIQLQEQLEQQQQQHHQQQLGRAQPGDVDDLDPADEDADADTDDLKRDPDPQDDGHESDLDDTADADHEDDVSTHRRAAEQHQLQLLADANSLPNGAQAVLSVSDPTIHPALQALAAHHDFTMDVSHGSASQAGEQSHQSQQFGSAEQMARQSGYPDLTIDSALSKRLARDRGLRLAVQRREEQVLNLKRRSNVEALLAHVSGKEAASQCKNCHKGHGPWNTCIVVAGQMCGSCANCWYNASGARCSFHEVRNPAAAHQPAVLPPQPSSSYASMPPMAAAAQQVMAANMMGSTFSFDPHVKYILDNAIGSARSADKRARQLMRIEIAAKELALSIVQYEETMQAEENMGHQQGQGSSVAPDANMTDAGD